MPVGPESERIADERNLSEVRNLEEPLIGLADLLDNLDLEVTDSVALASLVVHKVSEDDRHTADSRDTLLVLGTLLDRLALSVLVLADDIARSELGTVNLAVHLLAGDLTTYLVRDKLELVAEGRILGVELVKSIVVVGITIGINSMDGDKLGEVDRTAVVQNLNTRLLGSCGISILIKILFHSYTHGILDGAAVGGISEPLVVLSEGEVIDKILTGSDSVPVRNDRPLIVEVSLKLHDREMAGAFHEIIGVHLNEVTPVFSLGIPRVLRNCSPLRILIHEGIDDRSEYSCRIVNRIKDLGMTVNLGDALENRIPEDGLVSLDDVIAIHTVQAPCSGVKREGRRIEIIIGTTDLALGEVGGIIVERHV